MALRWVLLPVTPCFAGCRAACQYFCGKAAKYRGRTCDGSPGSASGLCVLHGTKQQVRPTSHHDVTIQASMPSVPLAVPRRLLAKPLPVSLRRKPRPHAPMGSALGDCQPDESLQAWRAAGIDQEIFASHGEAEEYFAYDDSSPSSSSAAWATAGLNSALPGGLDDIIVSQVFESLWEDTVPLFRPLLSEIEKIGAHDSRRSSVDDGALSARSNFNEEPMDELRQRQVRRRAPPPRQQTYVDPPLESGMLVARAASDLSVSISTIDLGAYALPK